MDVKNAWCQGIGYFHSEKQAIGNYHKVIMAIAGDRQATAKTREIAAEILKASKY
jgi:hypothetical protein